MEQLIIYAVLFIAGIFLTLLFTRWILRIDYSIKLKEAQISLLTKIAEKNGVEQSYLNSLKKSIK